MLRGTRSPFGATALIDSTTGFSCHSVEQGEDQWKSEDFCLLTISRKKTEYLGCNEHQDAENHLQGETVTVVQIERKKVRVRRLKWYGHVTRREEHYVERRVVEMKVHGRRKRGRPARRWLDRVNNDMKEKGLSAGEVYDRATCDRTSTPHTVGIR